MNNLDNATVSGSYFNAIGTQYCADDNTYTEYTYARRALACDVALRCELTCARPLTETELLDMLFGAA